MLSTMHMPAFTQYAKSTLAPIVTQLPGTGAQELLDDPGQRRCESVWRRVRAHGLQGRRDARPWRPAGLELRNSSANLQGTGVTISLFAPGSTTPQTLSTAYSPSRNHG